ncbi:MAG: FAD-dependent oxidoreductase [Phascolarctobacterium faecium]
MFSKRLRAGRSLRVHRIRATTVSRARIYRQKWKIDNAALPDHWQKEGRRLILSRRRTEQIVSAQLVLLAMGFIGAETQLFGELNLLIKANTIAANDNDYMTSIPGIFAAGDARRGQSLVVWAIAEGRGAAAAIGKYLTAVK